ncbi:S41 family peptidase [Asaia astilbis]|uniref:S41 family peptidase n=1 Tax=Asaia astilbis TaxID=610244 RepID=UPI000A53A49F|nr:S41 family peptidase [Asaia astilbis]
MIDDARLEGRTEYASLTWAPNGRTLAFVRARSESIRRQIALYTLDTGKTVWVTTPDYESFAPCFSPDGSFLWFLSDRVFNLKNGGPWGDRNTAPVYGPRTGVFALSLRKDTHFPFAPPTELDQPSLTRISPKTTTQPQNRSAIDLTDLGSRLYQLPIPAAEIRKIEVGSDTLYLLTHKAEQPASKDDDLVLKAVKIAPGDVKLTDFATGLHDVALTPDAKTLMLLAGNGEQPPKIQLVPAATDMAGVNASDTTIRLNGLRLRIDPGAEWVGMFNDAWRLHRDHFYDPALHGVDWSAAREQYRPLLSRIGDRSDLDDLLGQMVGDLNALHSQLQPAETSTRDNKTLIASLGAHLTRQPGGFLIDRLYEGDPDLPKDRSPLVAPGLDVQPGDLITALNGQTLADLPDLSTLLANQADKQVLLTLKRKDRVFQVVVTPIDARQDATLRLRAWEEERAQRVATASHGRIGYLHLRAMGSGDMERFTRDFFSQTEKDGLIIDVRRNFGGNIDSWVLSELLHKVWMFWSDHGSAPIGNMQQTFRGHLAILCDELTYSDGETFSQGVKALGIGPLIGTRTSGAGVWLNDDDLLVDNGMPRTAGRPFFDLKGQWLVENHGVDPVIPVENLPVATFKGEDAQLDKALEILSTRLRTHPIPALVPRPFDETNQAISPD